VTIPFASVEEGASVSLSADASPMGGLRILVVDDNPANRELATLLLQSQGAEVTTAENGGAALGRLSAQPFDAVLLDLRLPDVDGVEILRRLRRADGPNQHIPVLAFTAELLPAGAPIREAFDGVVGKPIDTDAFFRAIAEAVPGLRLG
jgi:CheY-like chemotaxis protein